VERGDHHGTNVIVGYRGMIKQIAGAIAEEDIARLEDGPERYRRLALAALKPVTRPTEATVDAAHGAGLSDAHWAIKSRADFRKAVRAMIKAAMHEEWFVGLALRPIYASTSSPTTMAVSNHCGRVFC
jgi:hypothetical protein